MPLTRDTIVQRLPDQVLANGTQIYRTQPHPLLQQLAAQCRAGDAARAEALLQEIGPLVSSDQLPMAALACLTEAIAEAARRLDSRMLCLLFQHNFNAHPLTAPVVDQAFKANDKRVLAALIEAGWDVNEAGPNLSIRPLLRHAVNQPDMRQFLLSHGASPLVENDRRVTPLETAAGWGSLEAIRELIAHGGDPVQDDSLLHAVQAGRLDNAMLLVANGADVNKPEKEVYPHSIGQTPRRTPLDALTSINPASPVRNQMEAWLLAQGANVRNLGNNSY